MARPAVVALTSLLAASALAGGYPPPGGWPPPPEHAKVVSVYDGDTVTLDTGDKVRLRWVNCPEMKPSQPFSKEAKELAVGMVLEQEVTLHVAASGRDGYGRIVAGLDAPTGSLSMALLEAGLGHVFVIPPDDTDITPLLAAQDRARAARRGIWSTESFQGPWHITSMHANAPGPDETNINGEYLRVANVSPGPMDMKGYKITNRAGKEFPFPPVVVPAGHTVQVRSGYGATQANPAMQLEVHLSSDTPVWDDEYDIATILDPNGRAVDHWTAGHSD